MTIPGIYGQRDARWGTKLLGYNTDPYYNLYHFGCAITSAANILWWVSGDTGWTPQRVNQWLKENKGYQAGGGLIIWAKLAELMRAFNIEYRGYTTGLTATNNFLHAEQNFAIAQLRGPGFPQHFAAMPYVNYIADSWDAKLDSVSDYTFVGAHLYSKIVRVPTPAPRPEPAPIQTPAAVPLPDVAPAPVPSNETPQVDPNPRPVVEPEPHLPAVVGGRGGEIPVHTPYVANPVVEDLPEDTPEYRLGFKPFLDAQGRREERHILLAYDVDAIDVSGQRKPIKLYASLGPVRSSGTFPYKGQRYFRGTSGSWFGWPLESEAKPEGEDPAPAPQEIKAPKLSPLALFLRFAGRFGRAVASLLESNKKKDA